MILVVTHAQDNDQVARVVSLARARGARVARFDTDLAPEGATITTSFTGGRRRVVLRDAAGETDLREVRAVWLRRFRFGASLPKAMPAEERDAAARETGAACLGAIDGLEGLHLERLHVMRRAEQKPLQLAAACEVGLAVPRTLITSDPAAARAFLDACGGEVIVKPAHNLLLGRGTAEERVMFTSRVTADDARALDDLRYCPMILQERLEKRRELRVTAVGGRLFVASVDSQGAPEGRDDWRRAGPELADHWAADAIPEPVAASLLRLLERLGLHYGAIDLVLTPEGRYVFLEVNPAGEFAWIEAATGLPISDAISELLVEACSSRA